MNRASGYKKQYAQFYIMLNQKSRLLFFLVTILAKSFLALVSRHFMSFTFLSAWHVFKFFSLIFFDNNSACCFMSLLCFF